MHPFMGQDERPAAAPRPIRHKGVPPFPPLCSFVSEHTSTLCKLNFWRKWGQANALPRPIPTPPVGWAGLTASAAGPPQALPTVPECDRHCSCLCQCCRNTGRHTANIRTPQAFSSPTQQSSRRQPPTHSSSGPNSPGYVPPPPLCNTQAPATLHSSPRHSDRYTARETLKKRSHVRISPRHTNGARGTPSLPTQVLHLTSPTTTPLPLKWCGRGRPHRRRPFHYFYVLCYIEPRISCFC